MQLCVCVSAFNKNQYNAMKSLAGAVTTIDLSAASLSRVMFVYFEKKCLKV